MKCFNVTCVTDSGDRVEVGVMTDSKASAMKSAEYSLLEGRHIKAKALTAAETDGI